MEKKKIKYRIQRILGRWLDRPVIPKGKTYGYALVRSDCSLSTFGRHTQVSPPYYFRKMIIGDYSYISKNANVSNTEIGKFCSIGPNFNCGLGLHPTSGISTAPMFYSTSCQNGTTLCKKNSFEETKQTHIGNDVYIGANVFVLDGVTIGDGAVVGAGAVVVHDVPPYAVVVGVPAKVVKYRFDEDTIKKLLSKQWWNLPEPELTKVRDNFWNVRKFIDSL